MSAEAVSQTSPAVPPEIDQRVIMAAIRRGEIIPHIVNIVGETVATTFKEQQS